MNKAVKMSILKTITGLLIAATLTACGGGGGEARAPTTSTTTTTTSPASLVASILLTAPSPLTLNADGSSSKALTVRALDASGGLVNGALISLSTSGATLLDKSSITTDTSANGPAIAKLSANQADQTSRVATITATCSSCSAAPATLQVAINGATLAVTTVGGTALTVGGNPITLRATVKDTSGNVLPIGVPVTFSTSDNTIVGLSSTAATTDTSFGNANTTVTGLSNGSATVKISALGTDVTVTFTVTATIGSLSITAPSNNTTMFTGAGSAKTIVVSAPGATQLSFVSTMNGATFTAPVYTGTPGAQNFGGSSIFTATAAGTATVQVIDNVSPTPRVASVTLRVSPPLANKVILNSSQTTVALATGNSTPTILLTATALSTSGASEQPVANVPILFSMSGGPGTGEYITPAYAVTDSSGNATAQFFSGTSASIPNGIVVSAAVQGTNITSNPNALLTIGGRALSVAIGQSSAIRQSADGTLYFLDHSVQVTDANNNPVPNQLVTLRIRPVAFSLGSGCRIDTDQFDSSIPATYCSEDLNANGSLDSSEDGIRVPTTVTKAGQCSTLSPGPVGTADTLLTPQNSVGGAVPATVTTDATGTASFALTYLKAYSIWIVDKISASVSVNGTESGSSTIFQLPVSESDFQLPNVCRIPRSPFSY